MHIQRGMTKLWLLLFQVDGTLRVIYKQMHFQRCDLVF